MISRSRARRRAPSRHYDITADITSPLVNDRVYQHFDRIQGPTKVEQTMKAALMGDPLPQMLLFNAMIDTWPDLGQALNQVADEAAKAPLITNPWAVDGEEPSQSARDKAALVQRLRDRMTPDLKRRREGWHGTLKGLALGYFYGITVREIHWPAEADESGMLPESTSELDPIYYRYPTMGDQEEQLLFSPNGRTGGLILVEFDSNKFIVGEHRWHRGTVLQTAPLRPLVGYWLAANYGLKWLMQYAQIYGIPFRFGTYPQGQDEIRIALNAALANLGASGWGSAPAGTEINVQPLPAGAQALPQKELITMANNAVAKFILGQTLTSDVGDSGSRALGEVHEGVRRGRIESVVYFVSSVLNSQFVPAVLRANYPDESERPTIRADFPDSEDALKKVERDVQLFNTMGLPVAEKDLYERHNVRMPEEDEKLFKSSAPPSPPDEQEEDEQEEDEKPGEKAQAQRATGDHVQAAATINTATLDALQANVAKMVPQIAAAWLKPATDVFRPLVALALKGEAGESDFVEAAQMALATVPGLELDTDALESALRDSVGTAVLAGAGQKAIDLPNL